MRRRLLLVRLMLGHSFSLIGSPGISVVRHLN
jgi:hypothetical protein